MKVTFHNKQFNVVAGLKRYRQVAENEISLKYTKDTSTKNYIIARQKKKIYESLISLVIHEGIDYTVQHALNLYERLPRSPVKSKEITLAYERALESFFLLTEVETYLIQKHSQKRPSGFVTKQKETSSNKEASSSKTIVITEKDTFTEKTTLTESTSIQLTLTHV